MSEQGLQVIDKRELETPAENIRNLPMFTPPVDICESENEVILFADMPGVPMENVEIDLNRDQFTIRGSVPRGGRAGGKVLLSEYREGDYFRQFTLSEAIDREKIEATMKDGVLKVVLPKTEVAKPRKIEVKVS
jgi:HSP20 family molecular chaperone IbpA